MFPQLSAVALLVSLGSLLLVLRESLGLQLLWLLVIHPRLRLQEAPSELLCLPTGILRSWSLSVSVLARSLLIIPSVVDVVHAPHLLIH